MYKIISDSLLNMVKNGSTGIAAFIFLWIVGSFLERFIVKNVVIHKLHEQTIASLARTVKHICLLVGFLIVLKDFGIDLSGAFAGVGLTSFILGFALKDTLANVMSGLFILMYRPFHIGEYIIVGTENDILAEGYVETIDFRYTMIRTKAGMMLTPNSLLYTNPITLKKIERLDLKGEVIHSPYELPQNNKPKQTDDTGDQEKERTQEEKRTQTEGSKIITNEYPNKKI